MVHIDYNRPENLENLFSPEMNRRLDKWIDKHLEGTDFHFAWVNCLEKYTNFKQMQIIEQIFFWSPMLCVIIMHVYVNAG
jgi:hypothetical protein